MHQEQDFLSSSSFLHILSHVFLRIHLVKVTVSWGYITRCVPLLCSNLCHLFQIPSHTFSSQPCCAKQNVMEELSGRFNYIFQTLFLRLDPNRFVATAVNFSWLCDSQVIVITFCAGNSSKATKPSILLNLHQLCSIRLNFCKK